MGFPKLRLSIWDFNFEIVGARPEQFNNFQVGEHKEM